MNIERPGQQQLRLVMNEKQDKGEVLYATKVLQRKKMDGLLDFTRRNLNGQWYYYYSVGGLRSMKEMWDGRYLSGEDMECFMESLGQTLYQIDEYLLKHEQLCLDPSYIMYDVAKRKWRFLYLVETYEEQGKDIRALLDFFVSKLGGEIAHEDILYEFLSDCLQFDETVLPEELVRAWEERWVPNEPVPLLPANNSSENESISDGIQTIETEDYSKEAEVPTWKDRWNKIIYAKLYLVPFCSD